MEAITKAELARRLELSRARVSQLCKAGMPTLPGGKVDAEAAAAWIARRTDPSHQIGRRVRTAPAPAATPAASRSEAPQQPRISGDAGAVLLVAKAKKAVADARRAERLERLAAGELREADELRQYATEFSLIVRDHVLAMADRLAPALSATLDQDAIYKLIREDSYAMLRRLSKAIADAEVK